MWYTRRMRLYKARLGLVLAMIATMGFVWFCASVIDTNVHNLNDPQHISDWNIFKISQSV
mgnify:CR=1 FL=1|jgi:hypothetical protein